MKLFIVSTFVLLLVSCNSDNQKGTPKTSNSSESYTAKSPSIQTSNPELPSDPYDIMHVAFVDMPEKEDIQPMMEKVMSNHNLPVNGDNALKFANMLVSLRKSSVVGVTEMDILKHMYQHGNSALSIPDQAALSSLTLEKSK